MAGRGFWALAIGLLLCSGPAYGDDVSAKEKAWEACCEKAFHSCGGDAGDERGHFDLQGGQVYDYYGNTAKLNGSAKLKAVQQCIEKACPFVVDSNTTPQPAQETRLPIIFLPDGRRLARRARRTALRRAIQKTRLTKRSGSDGAGTDAGVDTHQVATRISAQSGMDKRTRSCRKTVTSRQSASSNAGFETSDESTDSRT